MRRTRSLKVISKVAGSSFLLLVLYYSQAAPEPDVGVHMLGGRRAQAVGGDLRSDIYPMIDVAVHIPDEDDDFLIADVPSDLADNEHNIDQISSSEKNEDITTKIPLNEPNDIFEDMQKIINPGKQDVIFHDQPSLNIRGKTDVIFNDPIKLDNKNVIYENLEMVENGDQIKVIFDDQPMFETRENVNVRFDNKTIVNDYGPRDIIFDDPPKQYAMMEPDILLDSQSRVVNLKKLRRNKHRRHIQGNALQTQKKLQQPGEIVFMIIICKGNQMGLNAKSTGRQTHQVKILIKSAVALTSKTLRFVIISDSKDVYKELEYDVLKYPIEYQRKLTLQYMQESFPADRSYMKYSGPKPCCYERIFAPPMLRDYDTAIYIDTDFLFLSAPEDVWAIFKKFDSQQLAAMAPAHRLYSNKYRGSIEENVKDNRETSDIAPWKNLPYYGLTGLNGGLMLMNLTRMNQIPGGWVKECMRVFDRYRRKMTKADQDILNIVFYEHPEWMFEVSCDFNYRLEECGARTKQCLTVKTQGASLLHGSASAFVGNTTKPMKMVFDSWMEHELGKPIRKMHAILVNKLKQSHNHHRHCMTQNELVTVLSKKLLG